MLHTLKVLVQWLPSSSLRIERAMTLGPKWGTEVQQDDVTIFNEHFPLALAIAEQPADGRFVIQIGFKGAVRHNEIGWILDGPPSVQAVHYFDEMPSDELAKVEHLMRTARKLSAVKGPELKARIKRFTQLQQAELRKAHELNAAASEAARLTSPMLNPDAFDRVAGYALRYEDGGVETLGPIDGRAAVQAIQQVVAENKDAPVDGPPGPVPLDAGSSRPTDHVTSPVENGA